LRAVSGASLSGGGSVTVFPGRSLGARDTAAPARAVCRTFGFKRTTLIDFLAWIGWSAGLRNTRDSDPDSDKPERDEMSRLGESAMNFPYTGSVLATGAGSPLNPAACTLFVWPVMAELFWTVT
jgi:hypothetical protein